MTMIGTTDCDDDGYFDTAVRTQYEEILGVTFNSLS